MRRGNGVNPSPFDEIRATSALLLWGLLAREAPDGAICGALSLAARRYWGPILATALGGGLTTPPPGALPESSRCEMPPSGEACDPRGSVGPATLSRGSASSWPNDDEGQYGARLFRRTWRGVDRETLAWLLATVPAFVRDDPLLGELALDWLLWDQPWLHNRPAAVWTARSQTLRHRRRVQQTYRALLRSRLGLWHLREVVPGAGFRLIDRLSGARTFLHTSSPPWPESDGRLLLARVYEFGRWRLLAGRCLLLDPDAIDELLTALHRRAVALQAPEPDDPRWRPWLKTQLIPLIAGQWAAIRLTAPCPDRYHGTFC